MNTRVKTLRKELKLSQEEFGAKLGITGAAISRIESGDSAVTDRLILSIIREYGVSEAWLRTGAGEMFEPRTRRDDIAAFMGQLLSGPDDFKTRFISVLANLDDSQWSLLADMAEQLAAEEENEKAGQE